MASARSRGRPAKYTKEIQDRLTQALRVGADYESAADYAGIAPNTFKAWRDGKGLTAAQHEEFLRAVKDADGTAIVALLLTIDEAAKNGAWQAAAWKLERRHPERFGRMYRTPPAEQTTVSASAEAGPIELRITRVNAPSDDNDDDEDVAAE